MKQEGVPKAATLRLSLYLRQLEIFQQNDRHTISSSQLGAALELTDAQVRKDLAYFGQFGYPGIGYKVEELISQVRKILGTDRVWKVGLVGAGNLGRALVMYKGFLKHAFQIASVFDNDPATIGTACGPHTVRDIATLPQAVREDNIRLIILTVPAESAQRVADQVVEAGVEGVLNFAPVMLNVSDHVQQCSVDLAVQLEQLSYAVKVKDDTASGQ